MKKIIALYLPQYHTIPENDEWWGKGYTEWTAVKSAKPLFKKHEQPKIPLNDNYYDLSKEDGSVWRWQWELAEKYGIYGFGIYHYWFGNNVQLLQKPAEILLVHKEIRANYCFVWANESWTRTWYGLEKEILANQQYGNEEEWKKHFSYLLNFFKDERYIKVDNKPMMCIYRSKYIDDLEKMIVFWQKMAQENGFPGIYIVVANSNAPLENRINCIDAFYNFEPTFSMKYSMGFFQKEIRGFKIFIRTIINKFKSKKNIERIENTKTIYKMIEKSDSKEYPRPTFFGIFPAWDNTPRRGYKGLLFKNSNPLMFGEMLKKTLELTNDDSFVFLNAWNEWGEGCYLEPDEKNKYEYLEIIKEVIDNE